MFFPDLELLIVLDVLHMWLQKDAEVSGVDIVRHALQVFDFGNVEALNPRLNAEALRSQDILLGFKVTRLIMSLRFCLLADLKK